MDNVVKIVSFMSLTVISRHKEKAEKEKDENDESENDEEREH